MAKEISHFSENSIYRSHPETSTLGQGHQNLTTSKACRNNICVKV